MKEIEYLNMDLDLFYEINRLPIHIASAGGIIPRFYQNIELADYNLPKQVRDLPLIHNKHKLIFNPKLRELIKYDDNVDDIIMIIESLYSKNGYYDFDIAAILNDDSALFDFYIDKIYGNSFIKMARRGFLSFDKYDILSPSSDLFHWVVMPEDFFNKHEISLDSMPKCQDSEFLSLVSQNEPFQLINLIDKSTNLP